MHCKSYQTHSVHSDASKGFHDICSGFLLVLGKKNAIPAAENVALFFLRYPFMFILLPVLVAWQSNQVIIP